MQGFARGLTGLAVTVLTASGALAALPGHTLEIRNDVRAQALTVSVRWPAPKALRDARGEVAVSIDGLPNTIDAGLPAVPVRTVKVALPRGMRLKAVQAQTPATTPLAGRVRPSRSMLPFSYETMDRALLHDEDAPAIPATGFPAQRVQTTVHVLHHVPVAIVNVYPVQVAADGASATVAADAQLTLSYEADPAARSFRAPTAHEAAAVAALVDNPEHALATAADPADAYDYLIISNATLITYAGPNSLRDLTDNLATRSLKARVVDVDTIRATEGKDLADKIRKFIKAEYERSAIRYVLLAADGDSGGPGNSIPVRRFTQKIHTYDGHWHWIENKIPADFYYSCLDADFDGNGNGIWAEATDGANGGDVDLLSEVVVGRMPMKTTAELANFVNKTIAYNASTLPKVGLLMGEELFREMNLYGDDYMNQLVGACSDHAYTTSGYGADWAMTKLYDRGGAWGGGTALTKINEGGFSVVHHLGHSSTDYNMRMSSRSIRRFTNAQPFFFYTQGCFPGDFTANDCFIEQFVRHDKGAVAAVANTCYGLGPEDPQVETTVTPGASQMLHRRWVDAIATGAADTMGRANQLSKENFIGLSTAAEMRWVFWDAHYFGDPALRGAR